MKLCRLATALVFVSVLLAACTSASTVTTPAPARPEPPAEPAPPQPTPAAVDEAPEDEETTTPLAELPVWKLNYSEVADSDLPVGTCVASALVLEGERVEPVRCDLSHGAEIFHRETVDALEAPTDEAANDRCEQILLPLIEPYGLTREPSGSTVVPFLASDASVFVCTIGSGFTGSFTAGTVANLGGLSYEATGNAVTACASDCSVNAVADLELQVSHVGALDDGRAVAIGIDGAGWVWGTGVSDEPVSLEPLTTYSYDYQGTFKSLPDGRVLLSSYDGGSYVWDLVTGQSHFLAYETEGEIGPYAQVVMPDGHLLFEGVSSWVAFDLNDVDAGPQSLPDQTPLGTIDAVSLADGRVFAATYDGLFMWDPSALTSPTAVALELPNDFNLYDIQVVASNGDGLVVVVGRNGFATMLDLATGEQTALVGLQDHIDVVTILQNGHIAAGDWSGAIALWDPAKPGEPVNMLIGHERAVTSIAELPDGRLVSAGADGTLRTWVLGD